MNEVKSPKKPLLYYYLLMLLVLLLFNLLAMPWISEAFTSRPSFNASVLKMRLAKSVPWPPTPTITIFKLRISLILPRSLPQSRQRDTHSGSVRSPRTDPD